MKLAIWLVTAVVVVEQVLYSDASSLSDAFSPWRPSFKFAEKHNEATNDVLLKFRKNGRFHTRDEVMLFAKTALRSVSPEIKTILADALNREVENPDVLSKLYKRVNYCNSTNIDSTLASLARLDDILAATTEQCNTCTDVFGILQNLACNAKYENLVDALVIVCEILLEDSGNSNPIMCNGTITMQAPFVYATFRESTPYDFCETLNMCFPPPKVSQASVSDRMVTLMNSAQNSRPAETSPKRRKRQTTPIKLLQLADIHVSTTYTTGSAIDCGMYVCCLDEFGGTGSARQWGEYECNIPERTMNHFLDEAAKLAPDFIIYSGDSPPHTIWDETLDSQLNCSRIVLKALTERLPGVTIYPAIGNHEMFPTNIYTMDSRYSLTATMNEAFAEMWRSKSGFGDEQIETMKKMAYYTMPITGYNKLRLLTINTNHYWYSLNFMAPLNRNTTEEAEHRLFIEDTLADAKVNGEKVIVLGHHPTTSLESTVRATRWWEEVVMAYSDIIIMQLSGHTHSDEFHLFLDPVDGKAKAINYVAPAFTSNTNVNPSMRMFYLDRDSYQPTNFQNYYADIDAQVPETPPPLVKNYDVQELYGMPDLSPESWKQLSISFVENNELFQKWYSNRRAGAVNGECTGECQKFQICSMWFPNYDEVDACILNWDKIIEEINTGAGSHVTSTVRNLLAALVAVFVVM